MSFGRQVYEFLLSSSQAYAKWDLEVSTSILKSRKKLLILLALAVPILAGCFAEAYEYHEMLGGKSAYAPAFYTNTIFLASIAVGLAAGLITGCIGAGGGFQALDSGDLFQSASQVFSIMPLISWRVFDGGRVRAEIRASELRQQHPRKHNWLFSRPRQALILRSCISGLVKHQTSLMFEQLIKPVAKSGICFCRRIGRIFSPFWTSPQAAPCRRPTECRRAPCASPAECCPSLLPPPWRRTGGRCG